MNIGKGKELFFFRSFLLLFFTACGTIRFDSGGGKARGLGQELCLVFVPVDAVRVCEGHVCACVCVHVQ